MTEFTEGHDDTRLTLLNDEETTDQPEEADDHRHHACADAGTARIAGQAAAAVAATTALATEQTVQALIEIAPELVEIRRTVIGSLVVRAWLLTIVAGASAPARIIQRKQETKFVDKVSEHAVAFRGVIFFNRE
jgi:hypothetical protein